MKKIIDEHAQPFYSSFTIPWREGIDPSQFTMSQLQDIYDSAPPDHKPALLKFIWERDDIPKNEKLEFFVEVLQTDESLKAREYAGRYFIQGANSRCKPLAIDCLLEWWEKNKDSLENPE